MDEDKWKKNVQVDIRIKSEKEQESTKFNKRLYHQILCIEIKLI